MHLSWFEDPGLLHELGHHLDYERLKLEDSFHTEGFYKRESSLMLAVLPRTLALPASSRRASAPPSVPLEAAHDA